MATQNNKLKILYLMDILLNKTDENHIMTATDLCEELKKYDISAERKSIYNDIAALQEYGMDIVQQKGANAGYYVASRAFELPELKLLVDAVQSSKFITSKKSQELISKLENLTSKYAAQQLQRDVFIYNRPKTDNETIYYNVDEIYSAIHSNSKISFNYAEWTVKKKLQLKKDGALYKVSPWALTWDDENYYLIAYDEEADSIKHYRVDKMQSAHVLNEDRQGKEKFVDFDLVAFAKKTFAMYGGREESITLVCPSYLAGVIIDRFGQDIIMVPEGDGFYVKLPVIVSQQFFGWITGLGGNVKIKSPENVRKEYKKYLEDIIGSY